MSVFWVKQLPRLSAKVRVVVMATLSVSALSNAHILWIDNLLVFNIIFLLCDTGHSFIRFLFSMAARIYIGRLTSRVSEKDIEHFFRGYGQIRDVLLKNGFGFVVSYNF